MFKANLYDSNILCNIMLMLILLLINILLIDIGCLTFCKEKKTLPKCY